MRFRRRTEESAGPAGAADAVDAVFVAILDGRHLWLAVPAQRGSLALRASGEGAAVADLPVVVEGDRSDVLSVRLDLAALPAGAASYDVVLAGPDGARPVHGDPGGRRTPLADDGVVRRVERGHGGALRVVVGSADPAAVLVAVRSGLDGIEVDVDGPGGPATLTHADLLAGAGPEAGPVRVGADRLPVRRRDDDLADPGRGAPLPSDGPLRLRWSRDGLLQARVVDEP
jgi:hypothetical protein